MTEGLYRFPESGISESVGKRAVAIRYPPPKRLPQLTVHRALPQCLHSRAVDASVSPHVRHRTAPAFKRLRERYNRYPPNPAAAPTASTTAPTSPILS